MNAMPSFTAAPITEQSFSESPPVPLQGASPGTVSSDTVSSGTVSQDDVKGFEAWLACTMSRYVDGDADAFDELYNALYPMVMRIHRRRVGDPALAEDLTQQTFIAIHRARDRYRPGSPVRPWVFTIARRLSIDALRRLGARRDRITGEGELPEQGVAPVEPYDEQAELKEAVHAAIEALPESQRHVIRMHKLEEKPMAEVAAALGIKESAARVRAHRGYNKLRETLAGWLPGRGVAAAA